MIEPLFKSGSRRNRLNYRPVNLTSVCCKTLDRIVVLQLTKYLEVNGLLSDHQYGFRKDSFDDQLLLTYAEVADRVDSGLIVDIIFLDFSMLLVIPLF